MQLRWVPILAIVAQLGFVALPASSLTISVEPDDFPNQTDISSAFPGVVLSAQGPFVEPPSVLSITDSRVSTGNRGFGFERADGLGVGNAWREGTSSLRADFLVLASEVSIDLVKSEVTGSDTGALLAFDAQGTLLATQEVTLSGPASSFSRVTISRDAADIAYVIAHGTGGSFVFLDNLAFTVVPEPSSTLLLALALAALASRRSARPSSR